MLNPDDEQFEAQLKRFRPLAAEPLPSRETGPPRRLRFAMWAGATAAVALLIAAALILHPQRKPAPASGGASKAGVDEHVIQSPLTLGEANRLLAKAPSFKAALDLLSHKSRIAQQPAGTESALSALSKEDFRP